MSRVIFIDASAIKRFQVTDWWNYFFNSLFKDQIIFTYESNENLIYIEEFITRMLREQAYTNYKHDPQNQAASNDLHTIESASIKNNEKINQGSSFRKSMRRRGSSTGLKSFFGKSKSSEANSQVQVVQSSSNEGTIKYMKNLFGKLYNNSEINFTSQSEVLHSLKLPRPDDEKKDRFFFGEFSNTVRKDLIKALGCIEEKLIFIGSKDSEEHNDIFSCYISGSEYSIPPSCTFFWRPTDFFRTILNSLENDVEKLIFIQKAIKRIESHKEETLNLQTVLLREKNEKPYFFLSADELIKIIKSIPENVREINLTNVFDCLPEGAGFRKDIKMIIKSIPNFIENVVLSNVGFNSRIVCEEADNLFIEKNSTTDGYSIFFNPNKDKNDLILSQHQTNILLMEWLREKQNKCDALENNLAGCYRENKKLKNSVNIFENVQEEQRDQIVTLKEENKKLKNELDDSDKRIKMLMKALQSSTHKVNGHNSYDSVSQNEENRCNRNSLFPYQKNENKRYVNMPPEQFKARFDPALGH